METSRETVDDAFLYMVKKLKKLEDMDVQTTLNVETIEQILQLQQEYTIGKYHLNRLRFPEKGNCITISLTM